GTSTRLRHIFEGEPCYLCVRSGQIRQWRRERDSEPLRHPRICNLKILRCSKCQSCHTCHGTLAHIGPDECLPTTSVRFQQLNHPRTLVKAVPFARVLNAWGLLPSAAYQRISFWANT